MTMSALRDSLFVSQHLRRALNHAWLCNVVRSRHRQHDSRSAIAMSIQYLISMPGTWIVHELSLKIAC